VAEEHYKDLASKPFYKDLVTYILSGPVVAMVWEGDGVVASARKLIGATNPLASEPGTIRGDFAIQVGRNVIHGSDSPENGERETGEERRTGGGEGRQGERWRVGDRDGNLGLSIDCSLTHALNHTKNKPPLQQTALWFPEGTVSWEQTMKPWLKE
jgi:hypothetical protein